MKDILAEFNEEMLFADGFDEALIGVGQRADGLSLAMYNANKCIEILMADGMTDEEAQEYFEFNVLGAYVGENTPMFCYLAEDL